jgi:hypothetical protein
MRLVQCIEIDVIAIKALPSKQDFVAKSTFNRGLQKQPKRREIAQLVWPGVG